jgi:hypothetical protein
MFAIFHSKIDAFEGGKCTHNKRVSEIAGETFATFLHHPLMIKTA